MSDAEQMAVYINKSEADINKVLKELNENEHVHLRHTVACVKYDAQGNKTRSMHSMDPFHPECKIQERHQAVTKKMNRSSPHDNGHISCDIFP